MKQMNVLNLVQKQGTNDIVTPILILDPVVKVPVEELMSDVVIILNNMGISAAKTMRESLFKLFNACCELSNMDRRRIYVDEKVSFSVTDVYQVTTEEEVLPLLKSFKDEISK